jgi:hypothetical protein
MRTGQMKAEIGYTSSHLGMNVDVKVKWKAHIKKKKDELEIRRRRNI